MTITSTKTTTVKTTVAWTATVKDDDGKLIGTMNANLSSSQPLGSYNFIVGNEDAYAECETEAAEAFAEFQASFQEAISGVTVTVKEVTND